MKSLLFATSSIVLLSLPASADPTVFVGIGYDFGNENGLGATVKLLTDNSPNSFVAAVGANYFPFVTNNQLGVDVSAGYVFQNVALTAGWDVIRNEPQVGFGYVGTRSQSTTSSTIPTSTTPSTIPTPALLN